jgi:hypothetical protein
MPRFRPRFSLLTTLLLMTIVCMAIVIILHWRDVGPLRQEVYRLRQEIGYLTVADENKIYAIQVPVTDSDIYRYRVYLPKNKKFNLYSRIWHLPARSSQLGKREWITTLAKWGSGSSGSIESGEFTIDVQLRPDPEKKDQWLLVHRIPGRGSGTSGTLMPWLNDRRAWSMGGDVSFNKQQEFNPQEGIILFQVRQAVVKEFNGGYSTIGADETKETPGVALFIAPTSIGEDAK